MSRKSSCHPTMQVESEPEHLPYIRERVANACDNLKCDGNLPCGYCKRRQRSHACHFSPPARRRPRAEKSRTSAQHSPRPSSTASASASGFGGVGVSTPAPSHHGPAAVAISPTLTRQSVVSTEEAEVPRDARLICDTQGKLVFIGDCAPLSLFQTVRQIVTSRVDPHAFTTDTSRVSMLENVSTEQNDPLTNIEPEVNPHDIGPFVESYLVATSALVDLFNIKTLPSDLKTWSTQCSRSSHPSAAVYYLVLSIGCQSFVRKPRRVLLHPREIPRPVQLVRKPDEYTLSWFKPWRGSGASQKDHAIGLHRTEVNDRFGPDVRLRRDRLWKSVRVLDLYLSISMGRPPAAADADCTVSYHCKDEDGSEKWDLLNASIQILSIIEGIIHEVYSRRKISLQLTEGISRQLREWSAIWLPPLHRALRNYDYTRECTGACQVLSSYYYAVMLVSRPFLMYEICKRVPEPHVTNRPTADVASGRSKLANACIDAATLMIGIVSDLVDHGALCDGRMPLIVLWLFAASLVVGVGLLGGFGRALEKHASMSVAALTHFSKDDAHASQYARIAESLRLCALEFLTKREAEDRRRIAEDSTRLFGLLPSTARRESQCIQSQRMVHEPSEVPTPNEPNSAESWEYEEFDSLDPAIFSLDDSMMAPSELHTTAGDQDGSADQVFGALNLFPLLDRNGHIDLEHWS
ncbi:fungal-specific transcription factor domain-containing protein [Xylariaceae sp. FL1019]|nr:fungal-specific transcription factor domain-containing protein [Xylariaceae sp. FL1019]